MRLDLARFGDITPHHRGAMVDAFAASTFVHGTIREVFLKRFRSPKAKVFEHAFLEAAARSTNLTGAGIASPLDFGLTDEGPILVVPRIGGRSLAALARQSAEIGRPVKPEIATYIVGEAIRILAEAESTSAGGVDAHGGVSPNAILVTPDGRIMLAEGCMWSAAADEEFSARISSGLSAFIPPERFAGHGPSRAGDVFGFGATLRWLLADRMDPALAGFCANATAEDPRRRYPSLVDARQALRAAAPPRAGRDSIRSWLASLPAAPPKSGQGVDFVVPSTWPRGRTPRAPTPLPPIGKQLLRSSAPPPGHLVAPIGDSPPRSGVGALGSIPPAASSSSRPMATQILPSSHPAAIPPSTAPKSARARPMALLPSSSAPPAAAPFVAPASSRPQATQILPTSAAAQSFALPAPLTTTAPRAAPTPHPQSSRPQPTLVMPQRDSPIPAPGYASTVEPPRAPTATTTPHAPTGSVRFESESLRTPSSPPPAHPPSPSVETHRPVSRPRSRPRGRTIIIERPRSLLAPFVIGFSVGLVGSIVWTFFL